MAWIREIEEEAAGGQMAELYAELRRQRELLAVAVSQANDCGYRVAHHVEALGRYVRDSNQLAALAAAVPQPFLPEIEQLLVDYAVKLTRSPGEVSRGDVATLRDAGLADEDILLANLVVAYFNFVNRIALGLGVEHSADEVSGYQVWRPGHPWLRRVGRREAIRGKVMPRGGVLRRPLSGATALALAALPFTVLLVAFFVSAALAFAALALAILLVVFLVSAAFAFAALALADHGHVAMGDVSCAEQGAAGLGTCGLAQPQRGRQGDAQQGGSVAIGSGCVHQYLSSGVFMAWY
jgi:AhpD family alkylhydroperoxidase